MAASIHDCDLLNALEDWEYKGEDNIRVCGSHLNRQAESLIHFLAGTAFACKIYWPFFQQIVPDYDLICHDYKGHGDSDNGDGEFDGWQACTERALTLAKLKGLEQEPRPVIGMGHSYGGAMTIIMAAKQPELFSALVLIDPFMVTESSEQRYRSMTDFLVAKTREKEHRWQNEADVKAYMASRFMFKDWHPEAVAAFIKFNMNKHDDGSLTLKCHGTVEAGVYDDKVTALWPSIRNLTVPAIILSGDQTVPFFAEAHEEAAALKDNIELIKVKGGHNYMQEYPRENAEMVRNAIKKLGY
ncbi:MAG TPA: alpha/beta hydrolase [Pseudomonadales bacterium]